MNSYWSLAVYAGLLMAVAAGALILSALVGEGRFRRRKMQVYECGAPLLGTARLRFAVKFYLVAILFVLFDVEVVFLVPWAVVYKQLGVFGLIEMGVFLSVLAFGLAYVWKRGALEWD
jgi:NADH-quinone oxidoreductase subunit A